MPEVEDKDTIKPRVMQIYLHGRGGVSKAPAKDTIKCGQKQTRLHFAERKYLRRSQRYEKSSAEASASLIMPRRSIYDEVKDTEKRGQCQICSNIAERKSDALQLKILIYHPKGTVCKGFRRKDRRFSYLQGEICGGRVLRGSAGEGFGPHGAVAPPSHGGSCGFWQADGPVRTHCENSG